MAKSSTNRAHRPDNDKPNAFDINRRILASDLSLASKAVLIVILDHCRYGSRFCTASSRTIAREAGITERQVGRVIPKLAEKSLIEVFKQTGSARSRHTIKVGSKVHEVGHKVQPPKLHVVGHLKCMRSDNSVNAVGHQVGVRTPNGREREKEEFGIPPAVETVGLPLPEKPRPSLPCPFPRVRERETAPAITQAEQLDRLKGWIAARNATPS